SLQVPSETTVWDAPEATRLTVPPPEFVTGSPTVSPPAAVTEMLPPEALTPTTGPMPPIVRLPVFATKNPFPAVPSTFETAVSIASAPVPTPPTAVITRVVPVTFTAAPLLSVIDPAD